MAALVNTTACQQMRLLAAKISSEPWAGVLGRTVRLEGGYGITDVQHAWASLMRAYPSLRVRFHERNGNILQQLRGFHQVPELSRIVLTPSRRVDIGRACIRPFGSVLIRAYYTPDAVGGDLTILAHDALLDEDGLGIVVEFLQCALSGSSLIKSEKKADYAATVKTLIEAERHSRSTSNEFWARHTAARGGTHGPTRAAGPTTHAGLWQTELDEAQVQAINASARYANVPVPALVHAAVGILLHRFGTGDRPIVGSLTSLRGHPGIERDTVGQYTTVLPIAIDVCCHDSVETIVDRARTALIEAQEHKFMPLMDIPGFADLAVLDTGSRFMVTLSVRQLTSGSILNAMRWLPMCQPTTMLHIDLSLTAAGGQLTIGQRNGVTPWPAHAAIASDMMHILNTFASNPGQTVASLALRADLTSVPTTMRLRNHPAEICSSAVPDCDSQSSLVADVMSEVIGHTVAIDDDFFRAGGSSLTAVRVVTLLRARNIGVSLLEILQRRTPRAIAIGATDISKALQPKSPWPITSVEDIWNSRTGRRNDDAPSSLVPLRPDGDGAPLFCVHWGMGTVRFLGDVVDDFRFGHPVYGLEAVGYRGNVRPLLSINEMACRYAAEIQAVQPSGPYHLVGVCQGALIALEIARILRAIGEQMAPLALVKLPAQTPPYFDPGWGLDEMYLMVWELLRRTGNDIETPDDRARALSEMVEVGFYEPDDDPAELDRLAALYAACCLAQNRHEPTAYSGPVVILHSSAKARSLRTAWEHLLPDYQLVLGDWDWVLDMVRDPRFYQMVRGILQFTETTMNGDTTSSSNVLGRQ